MKIRIKFTKSGMMKFIGHLDMMRYFQKAMRRAQIDIMYSAGYSPHQIMSFAAPLGVGITSEGEYLDIEVNHTLSSSESIAHLNDVMVEGICVTEYKKLPDEAKTAMSIVSAADYFLYCKDETDSLWNRIVEFYEQPQIPVIKKTKKGENQIDLKTMIYEIHNETRMNQKGVFMKLSSGSIQNIKPQLVLEAYSTFINQEIDPLRIQEHRIEVYTGDEGVFLPLGSMGEEIE